MDKETTNQVIAIESFLKESMCITGAVVCKGATELEHDGIKMVGLLFKLNDKTRGEFYISWMTPSKKTPKY